MLFPGPRAVLRCAQGWGGPEGTGEELVVRDGGTYPKNKDHWTSSAPVPKATVVQPELLQINCNAVFVSTGCFSITFPKGLEGTSTIDIHPFQTVCSNIPLTTKTISNPITPAKRPFLEGPSTANDVFPNDVVRRKQRSEAEAQVGIRQVLTTGKEGRWWQTIWTGSSTADLKGYKPENRMAKTPAIINTSLYIFSLPVVTNHSSFARVNCKDALSGKVCFLSGL